VLGVQLPGREDRVLEPPAADLADVVAEVTAELATVARRSLLLLGISLGGLIAFEVARQLEAAGTPPAALVVLAARAPEFWLDYPSENPPAAEVNALLPPAVRDSEFAEYAGGVLRADLRLTAGYQVRPTRLARTPLWSVSGSRDDVVTAEQMRDWRQRSADFRGHRVIEADHHDITEPDLLAELVASVAGAARSASR
jgi:surfactin synthase thioesterase subunit